ncbi:ABC transporter permease [Streptomyces sp. NPDC048445]|uniref:ABC transporter permease n=1 Tax=Streptomyces sp. NPDC048445 TaxID=3365553 RepID=UPI00371BEB0D
MTTTTTDGGTPPEELLVKAGADGTPARIAWRRFRRDKVSMACAVIVVALIVVALIAPLLTALNGHPPDQPYPDQLNSDLGGLPRGSAGGISGDFWFGVEPGTGRDLFSRVVHGARVSLLVSLSAAVVTTVIGTVAGLCAGYFGGWVDAAIGRLMDLFFSFPSLIFMIALLAVLPDIPRIPLLVVILSTFAWPTLGRIVRGQTMSLRRQEFVEAAEAAGCGTWFILLKEILPNLVAPITVYSTMVIPAFIETEAALSFLGLGIQPPTASWGQMLSSSVTWYSSDPMYFVVPGIFLFVTVLSFNLLGDGLRDSLDPRGR